MLLVTTATAFEMAPIQNVLEHVKDVKYCLTGWGPMETALRLTRMLSAAQTPAITAVFNFGVAGAYPGSGLQLLDFCLAEREVLGDFGICLADEIAAFEDAAQPPATEFSLMGELLRRAEQVLVANAISYKRGTFVTVSCASGTAIRGRYLGQRHRGLCENMEGAAGARVCAEFGLPFLEFRCISNLVEDRDQSRWQLTEACQRLGPVAAILVRELLLQSKI